MVYPVIIHFFALFHSYQEFATGAGFLPPTVWPMVGPEIPNARSPPLQAHLTQATVPQELGQKARGLTWKPMPSRLPQSENSRVECLGETKDHHHHHHHHHPHPHSHPVIFSMIFHEIPISEDSPWLFSTIGLHPGFRWPRSKAPWRSFRLSIYGQLLVGGWPLWKWLIYCWWWWFSWFYEFQWVNPLYMVFIYC